MEQQTHIYSNAVINVSQMDVWLYMLVPTYMYMSLWHAITYMYMCGMQLNK